MNSGTVALIAALCTALGTILGVGITSVIQWHTSRLNRESEERKHYKEVVVKAAIETWRESVGIAKSIGGTIYPLESFIIALASAADVIFDPTTDESNLAERLEKSGKLVEIAERCAMERTERYKRIENEAGKRKRQG
jgi:hypothetical protein